MQTYSSKFRWQLVWAAVVMIGVCVSAIRARASCAESPARIVWSYPAEGDQSVPLDAEIRVISRSTLLNLYQATLNGTKIDPSDDGVYPTDGLEPDTDYVFRIIGPKPRSSSEATPTLFELTFHTGTELASEVPAPRLLDSTHGRGLPDFSELCSASHSAGECFDTPSYVYYDLELERDDDAVAWLVEDSPSQGVGKIWPSACNPVLTLHEFRNSREPVCVSLHAISANGTLSEPTKYCTPVENQQTLAQTASAEQASRETSSCAVATLGGQRGLGGFAAGLWACGAVLYLRRWRRQGLRNA